MELYLLKFSACLFIFWLIYYFLLEKQNTHNFKRFYLLGSIVTSISIPLLTITTYIDPVANNIGGLPNFTSTEALSFESPTEIASTIDIGSILWTVYGIGVSFFLIRFVVNLGQLIREISKNDTMQIGSFIYVLLKNYRIPHSFFKYIFINKQRFEDEAIPDEVLLHEQTHAKQLHSVDIIFIEMLQIVFWFHPLIYVLKHHIKLNHEFLADQAVLSQGTEPRSYQTILLQFSSNTPDYQLSSAINYSSFKKRFTVMKTQTSNTRKWLSTLFLIPIIAILFYSFAEREYIELDSPNSSKKNKTEIIEANNDPVIQYLKKYEVYKKLQSTPPHYVNKSKEEQMKMEALFSDLGGMYFRMSKANKAKVKRPNAPILPYAKITLDGKTYYKKKSELTKEEKATLPPPPPPPIKESKGGPNYEDTPEVYNTDYARSIELKILNNNSYVIDGIKATKKTFVSVFNKLHQDITPEVRNRIMNIHVSSPKEISNKEVWFIYNSLKDYGFYRLVTSNQVVNRAKGNTPFAIESNIEKQQNPPTKKEIDAYNAWAKKKKEEFKKRPKSETVQGHPYLINNETFRYYNSIYDRMTPEQKNKSEFLPEAVLVTEWPMPEYTVVQNISQPIQEKATKQQIKEYNTWAKKINVAMRKARANKSNEYPIVKQKELDRYINIYKNLMTAEQRQNSEPFPSPPPPPPPAPEESPRPAKIELKEIPIPSKPKVLEVKDVPAPPPPPKPEEPIVFIKKMVNANAQFFYEGKSISKNDAVELVRNNPKLNVHSKKTDSKQPLVYLSKKPIVIEVKEESRN